MFRRCLFAVSVIPALLIACSSNSSSSQDAGVQDAADEFTSKCGQPGDMGNQYGVGLFCYSSPDCAVTPNAHLCSSFGDSTTHFCTNRCCPPDAGAASDAASEAGDDGGSAACPAGWLTDCGQGATCECDSMGQCGCTPTKCL